MIFHNLFTRNRFRLCDPVENSINNALDMANLFENLASNFAGVVQYNKDNSPHATITIDDVSILTAMVLDESMTPLRHFRFATS